MKRLITIALLASGAFAADYSQMSTEEMINMQGNVPLSDRPSFQQEMQKRMQNMTPQERQNHKGMMGQGMGMGKGMGRNSMNQPTFAEYDLNNDGSIGQVELEKAQMKRMNQNTKEGKMLRNAGNIPTLKDIDSNNDGTISKEEFSLHQIEQMKMKNRGQAMGMGKGMGRNSMNQPTFAEYDINDDGAITPIELKEARGKRMDQNEKEGKMQRNAENAPEFSTMDTNKDGILNQEEFRLHQTEQMKMKNK